MEKKRKKCQSKKIVNFFRFKNRKKKRKNEKKME